MLCSEGGQAAEGTKKLKTLVFESILPPSEGVFSVASRGEESEKHPLENTVWNPFSKNWAPAYLGVPFRIFRTEFRFRILNFWGHIRSGEVPPLGVVTSATDLKSQKLR